MNSWEEPEINRAVLTTQTPICHLYPNPKASQRRYKNQASVKASQRNSKVNHRTNQY